MPTVLDLGARIELVPMDAHFHEISIALYRQQEPEGPEFLVHSYSQKEGTEERIRFVIEAMKGAGNISNSVANPSALRFNCGDPHDLACRRLFLNSCKLHTGSEITTSPLKIFDKKADKDLRVISEGNGVYSVTADNPSESMTLRRIAATAGGLAKLGEMATVNDRSDQIRFECGHSHDQLVGVLLPRALNVRTAMREAEAAAARGVLSAPSAQDS